MIDTVASILAPLLAVSGSAGADAAALPQAPAPAAEGALALAPGKLAAISLPSVQFSAEPINLLPPPKPGETFEERVREHAKKYIGRGEPGASEIMANLFDADYLMKHELVFIGSPDTVAKKIHATAQAGLFNVFMGEFNFSDLPEADLMRSIRLFGEKVIPALRSFEPF